MSNRVGGPSTPPLPPFNEPEPSLTAARPACENTVQSWVDQYLHPTLPHWAPEPGPSFTPAELQQGKWKHPSGSPAVAPARKGTGAEATYDLANPSALEALIAQSKQVNSLSQACGNGDVICSGAALTNGLLMLGADPAKRVANADAVDRTFTALGAQQYLPAAVDPKAMQDALAALRSGQVRPRDAEVLQQVAFAIVCAVSGSPNKSGANEAEVLGALAALVKHGAQLDGMRLTLLRAPNPHWIACCGAQRADSWTGSSDHEGPDSSLRQGWLADVEVKSAHAVELRTRTITPTTGAPPKTADIDQAFFVKLDPQGTPDAVSDLRWVITNQVNQASGNPQTAD